ncbi:hypothetical protein ACFZDP_45420 [Streptomyces mirabilis]|uniref:hypothetical protein n=1 Tax=Streptomyces mirabilis TaxID=68239 RepID=UPI0036E24B6F
MINTAPRGGNAGGEVSYLRFCPRRFVFTRQKDANRVLAVGRAPVEHGFAHLKNWRAVTKLLTDPARATRLLRALLVLTNLEVNR